MTDLPDRIRSRAVLFGASEYRRLPDIRPVRQNLRSLHHALTEPVAGVLAPTGCTLHLNPRSVDAFMEQLTRACRDAADVLLVYYAGHGVLDDRGRLHLALGGTDPDRPQGNAVPFELVKEQVERARAGVRVLVVDCCFSGRAMGWQAGVLAEDVVSAVGERVMETAAEGLFVLTSPDATEMGRFVVGERHTAFTDALLQALHPGDGREVRLRDLYGATLATLRRRELPLPRCRQDDSAGRLIIRRGVTPATASTRPPGSLLPSAMRRIRMVVLVMATALTVGIAVTVAALTGDDRPAPVFVDDFSGPVLDATKWLQPTLPAVVAAQGGSLRFAVRPGVEVNTALNPLPLPATFEEISFDVTIPAYAKAGPGGAALVLNPDSESPQWLVFGPTPGGPAVSPLICAEPPCVNGVYEDFVEPVGRAVVGVGASERVPVRIVREDGTLRFYVRDTVAGETPADPGPLVGFRFAISAADDESWDIEVDDLVCR